MFDLIKGFPVQLKKAVQTGKITNLKLNGFVPSSIVISGMGGSGIGAHITKMLSSQDLHIPFEICSSYEIPLYLNEHSLFIASSYSGNTEETLSCLYSAISRNATIVCLSSGGELKTLAQTRGLDFVSLPSNIPYPRATLAFSLVEQLYILHYLNLINDKIFEQIDSSADFISEIQDEIIASAKEIALFFYTKIPVIYSSNFFYPVILRLKQQINENAKQCCFINYFPEMNHNEIVGIEYPDLIKKHFLIIFVKTAYDLPQIHKRMDILHPIFQKKTASITEIYAKGNNIFQQVLYLVHLFDLVSYFLALNNKVEPGPVITIEHLKNKLKEFEKRI